MRLIFIVGLMLSACTGACGPKPLKTLSSSQCVSWTCPPLGECSCADKK